MKFTCNTLAAIILLFNIACTSINTDSVDTENIIIPVYHKNF